MKTKRIFAYLIDFLLITIFSTMIFQTAFKDKEYAEYKEKSEQYIKHILNSGSSDYTEDELVEMTYDLNKTQIPLLIIELGLTVFYFGIFSFLLNGQTLGKKLLKIRVVPIKGNKLNPPLYILRELILTNSIFKLGDILNITLNKQTTWLTVNSVLTYCENIVIILLLGVMIFRTDERSLHDLIFKTNVVEVDDKKSL